MQPLASSPEPCMYVKVSRCDCVRVRVEVSCACLRSGGSPLLCSVLSPLLACPASFPIGSICGTFPSLCPHVLPFRPTLSLLPIRSHPRAGPCRTAACPLLSSDLPPPPRDPRLHLLDALALLQPLRVELPALEDHDAHECRGEYGVRGGELAEGEERRVGGVLRVGGGRGAEGGEEGEVCVGEGGRVGKGEGG